MSGGSYNYLCFKTPEELPQAAHELERMLDDAILLGYADDFAAELANLRGLMRRYHIRAEQAMRNLELPMRSMEWWRSCDYGEDDFKRDLAKWREER